MLLWLLAIVSNRKSGALVAGNGRRHRGGGLASPLFEKIRGNRFLNPGFYDNTLINYILSIPFIPIIVMSDDNQFLLDEYILSAQLMADGDPVRCVTVTSSSITKDPAPESLELLSGAQSGILSRIVLPRSSHPEEDPTLFIQPGGENSRHPHQIVAILSGPTYYATGCKDGNVRLFHSQTHELVAVLEGHTNAVTSLSWIASSTTNTSTTTTAVPFPWLVSGSWDGTAKIWSIGSNNNNNNNNTFSCLCTLTGHENTVSVAGLPAESEYIRKLVTVSAGVANGNSIVGHTVRIWRLSSSSSGGGNGGVISECIAKVSNDHAGPMRDVVYDPDTHAIYTCSNDGAVKIRSAEDGSCCATLAFPGMGGEIPPMLLSLCVLGNCKTKCVVAGAEDGNVVIWDISSGQTKEAQVIPHPGCVWKVACLKPPNSISNSASIDVTTTSEDDFVTACHDGQLRIFTRTPSKAAPESVLSSFQRAVSESMASRSSGPTSDEIAKLPHWEKNYQITGRSEGQVHMFQKNNGKTAIAAQWSMASRTWIEVGEVTGTNTNAGQLNGKHYDHVLPIEIEVPGRGVKALQIGYNNGENPFAVAQSFIDEYSLDQGYLAQIADYIRQRAGESGPTLGGGRGGGASAAAAGGGVAVPTSVTMEVDTPTYYHLPMKGYKIFDGGIDSKGLTKVVSKIRELNDTVVVPSTHRLTSNEAKDVLDSLSTTLSMTNRYHASSISTIELAVLHKVVTQWDARHAFPALDLARMVVLHPDATNMTRRGYWEEVLRGAIDMCLGLGEDGLVQEVAVPMLTMRLIANSYKGGCGSAAAAGSLLDR